MDEVIERWAQENLGAGFLDERVVRLKEMVRAELQERIGGAPSRTFVMACLDKNAMPSDTRREILNALAGRLNVPLT